jgi:hypothetical protein
MHHALPVCIVDGVGNVVKNPDSLSDGQLTGSLQSRAQRLSFDARHRIIKQIVFRAGKEERDDVRMLQSRGQLDLAAEAADVEPGAELGRQNFDDDIAAERDFADNEDARHPAAEVVDDFVAIAERTLEARGEITYGAFVQGGSAWI